MSLLHNSQERSSDRDPLLYKSSEKVCDYVIVFPYEETTQEDTEFRDTMMQRIEDRGMQVTSQMSRDGDEVFFLITAPKDWFHQQAELLEIEFQLKPEFGGAYTTYKVENGHLFPENTFTSLKRQQIIHEIFERTPKQQGLGYDMDNLIAKGKLNHFFPFHDEEAIQYLMVNWIWKRSLYSPLNSIRNYFGEKIGLYFAFLETYTLWLIVPSIIGLPLFVAQVSVDDSVFSAAFSIFMSLWLTVFFTKWKRQTAIHTFEWNTMSITKAERQRPEFYGDERPGFYSKAGFVSLEDNPRFKDHTNLYYPEWKRNFKYFVVTPLICAALATVITGTFGLIFAAIVKTDFKPYAGVTNAVFIIVMNALYSKIAEAVTNWENHRTDTDFENALILKTFAFQFVNSYISLFYIAFIKSQSWTVFGRTIECQNSCLEELQIQLASIFLIQMFWGQFQELAIPYIVSRIQVRLEDRKLELARQSSGLSPTDSSEISEPELQAKLPRFPGLMSDYNEMLIQMGYVTLFSAAFPIAPLAALMNNLVEMRTDGIKMLRATQRPHYEGASDIGSWQPIMALLSIVCILTNCGLIYVTLEEWSFAATVLLENILLFLKFQLDIWFEPLPPEVVKAIAKREFFKQIALENAHKPMPSPLVKSRTDIEL